MTTMLEVLRIECGNFGEEAADHIEYLEEQIDTLKNEHDQMTKERDQYRAEMLALNKLLDAEEAKAVVMDIALREIIADDPYKQSSAGVIARAALAQLEAK